MAWRHNPTNGTPDGSATVTVVTAGLSVEEVGRITRTFADVTVLSVAEALCAPLSSHTVVAARDSTQVAELLARFGHSPTATHLQYALPADPDPGLSQALGAFDVLSIEPRDDALILSLGRAHEFPGTASDWVRRLGGTSAGPRSDGEVRPSRSAGVSHVRSVDKVSATPTTAAPKPRQRTLGTRRPLLTSIRAHRRTVGLVSGSLLVALVGAGGLFAFRSLAGMMFAAFVGLLLVACTAGVLSVRQRLETVARRVEELTTGSAHPGKPSKSVEGQLRSLRSAVSVNTSTVGSSTAAVNELVQRLGRLPEDTPKAG